LLGVRRTLSREQKEEAAEGFGAEGEYLSAAKKLLDTRHEAYKAVTGIRGQVLDLRDSDALCQRIAGQLAVVQSTLDQMLVDKPRRRILRSKIHTGGMMELIVHPGGGGAPVRRQHLLVEPVGERKAQPLHPAQHPAEVAQLPVDFGRGVL
jgi:hypothetical protein